MFVGNSMSTRTAVIRPDDTGEFAVFIDGRLTEVGLTHEAALAVRSTHLYNNRNDEWELV